MSAHRFVWAAAGLILAGLEVGSAQAFENNAESAFGATWTAPQPIAQGEEHEYPDVAVDGEGTAWVVWIGLVEGQERVFVRPFQGSQGGTVLEVGFRDGLQFSPRIVASGDRIWVAWSAKETVQQQANAHWRVAVRELKNGQLGQVRVVSGSDEDALRPALGLDDRGSPWVAWESRVDRQFRVVAQALDAPAGSNTMVVADRGELNLRPVLTPAPAGGIYVIWDAYYSGEYRIMARRIDDHLLPPIEVSDEPADNIGPGAVTAEDGRVFVAYSTNADERGGRRIGKTLRVKVLLDDHVHHLVGGHPPPVATAPGRLDAIEFPTVALDPSGRLWIFARRGQGFVAFRYEEDQWYPPIDLSRRGWGGRGRNLRVAWSEDGFHLVARRLHMLSHQLLIPPQGIERPIRIASIPPEISLESCDPLDRAPPTRSPPHTAAGAKELILGSLHLTDTFLSFPGEAYRGGPIERWYASHLPLEPLDGSKQSAVLSIGLLHPGETTLTRLDRDVTYLDSIYPPIPPEPREGPPIVLEDGVGGPRPALPSAAYAGREDSYSIPLSARQPGFYFGDLHTHCWMSDGAGDPDEVYTRSRDLYGFDFVALTDHGVENGNRLLPSEWDYQKLMADFFYEQERFVTFVAYEWTSNIYPAGGGHRNIYFPGPGGPLLDAALAAPETLTLFELLKKEKAIAVPHHIGWTGTDWENHDPDVQRAVEIVSVHGAFEKPGNGPVLARHEMAGMFIRDGLAQGLKFGLVGGTDGHGFPWHYGVSRKKDIWRTGLTGLLAPRLNRLSLFSALRNRLSIATSGAPISIWFSVNGAPMGSELVLDNSPRFGVRIEGTSPIRVVALIRDGEDLMTFPGNGTEFSKTILDNPPTGPHFYYLRVVQEDSEVAWSSPVWVEMKGRIMVGPADP